MAYVQEYKPGKFQARKRVNGKLISKSFNSRSEAWAWADAPADTPPAVIPPPLRATPSGITLSQFIDGGGYVTMNQRESTQATIESFIRAHIRPRWGGTQVHLITFAGVQSWVVELSNSHLAPRTVHHISKALKQILEAAVRGGLIDLNPAAGVVLPRIEDEEMRFLTASEVQILSDAFDERYRAFVPLCAYGGLRIGEAFGLRWKRLDLFKGTVEVAEIATEVKGRLVLGQPKTRAGRRTLTIPRATVNALVDHRRLLANTPDPDDFVFQSRSGPMRSRSFRKWRWAPAVQKVGLDGLTPHDLRHTAVAMWIAAGASPKEIAARAGHTSVSFSLDRYGHLYPSLDVALANRLDVMIESE